MRRGGGRSAFDQFHLYQVRQYQLTYRKPHQPYRALSVLKRTALAEGDKVEIEAAYEDGPWPTVLNAVPSSIDDWTLGSDGLFNLKALYGGHLSDWGATLFWIFPWSLKGRVTGNEDYAQQLTWPLSHASRPGLIYQPHVKWGQQLRDVDTLLIGEEKSRPDWTVCLRRYSKLQTRKGQHRDGRSSLLVGLGRYLYLNGIVDRASPCANIWARAGYCRQVWFPLPDVWSDMSSSLCQQILVRP